MNRRFTFNLPVSLLLALLTAPAAAQPGAAGQAGVQAGGTSAQGKIDADITQPGVSDLSIDKTNVQRRTTNQEMRDEVVHRKDSKREGRHRSGERDAPAAESGNTPAQDKRLP